MRIGYSQRVSAAFRHNRRGHRPVGLWQSYAIGETLIAAVTLSAFVVGIAWVGTRVITGSIASGS